MASTFLLRLTNFIQFLNVLYLPIFGLLVAAILTALVEAFTFGYADQSDLAGLTTSIILFFFGLALFYLIDTIGLIKKMNIFRILSILVNLAIAGFIGYSTFANEASGDAFIIGVVFTAIYLIPVLVLSFHRPTIALFSE